MKNLMNEPWGKLAYDKKNNRIIMIIKDPAPNQFEQLLDQTVTAVQQYKVNNCLADVSNREGITDETQEYSVRSFKIALDQGLKRLAIVAPTDKKEKQKAEKFVKQLGSGNVCMFTDTDEALSWLEGTSGSQRKVA